MSVIQTQLDSIPEKSVFYLFSYGSNHSEQLSQRLCIEKNVIQHHSHAAKLEGHKRGFFSHSKKRKGPVATIYEENSSYVMGIALAMRKEKEKFYVGDHEVRLDQLAKAECVETKKYVLRSVIGLKIHTGDKYKSAPDGYAFVGNLDHKSASTELVPSGEYLIEISKMLMERRRVGGFNANDAVKIDVIVYENGQWKEKEAQSFNT